jgi:hypothetical protein
VRTSNGKGKRGFPAGMTNEEQGQDADSLRGGFPAGMTNKRFDKQT